MLRNHRNILGEVLFLAQLKAMLLVITTYGVIVIVCVGIGGVGIGIVDKS